MWRNVPKRPWAGKAEGQGPCFGSLPIQRAEGGRTEMPKQNKEPEERLGENQSVNDQRS